MKKLLSIMLSAIMVMAMFSGLVLFESSAASFETVGLKGVQGWTQAELDTSSGNNGYANSCFCSMTIETGSKYLVGDAKQAIKCVYGGTGAYNSCLVNWTFGTGGPCTATNCWQPVSKIDTSAYYDGIRIAVLNKDGEPTDFSRVVLRVTQGWNYSNNMWVFDGLPVGDEDGYLYFPFNKFGKYGTPPVATSITDYLDSSAFGISMLCYGSEPENTTYYSDFEFYKGNPDQEEHVYSNKSFAFINQYTEAQAKQMKVYSGEATFKKEGDKIVISGVSAKGEWSNNFAFDTATDSNQWGMNPIIDGINVFKGSGISNKTALGFTFSGNDTSKITDIIVCLGSSTKKVAIDLKKFVRTDNTFVCQLNDATFAGAGWYQDCPTFADTFPEVVDQCKFQITTKTAGESVTVTLEDAFTVQPVETEELGKAIIAADEVGIDTTAARALYFKTTNFNQNKVDAMAQELNAAVEDLKYGYEKAKTDLNDLLNIADALGFFEESYEHFEEVSEADAAYSNPDSSLGLLRYYVALVREYVAAETTEGDLYDAIIRCCNAWEYNYIPESYKALLTAIDEAWALIEDEPERATEILNTAYDALEPALTRGSTADFFEGWTTVDVNNVVTANSAKLCDSIGDGLNQDGVYNGGDFSNNTAFEAYDNFIMTALEEFDHTSMGWKNMDRSGTLATKANYGSPAFDATGLSACDGIRFKLDVEGSAQRLLIGLSNCADMTRESYALMIRPEFVDADGYINIPFSYFQNAWWCNSFAQKELDQVVVLIFEAYDVEEGTSITISDFKGYNLLGGATEEEIANLEKVVEILKAFDIDGKYAEIIASAEALTENDFSIDYQNAYNEIMDILSAYRSPEAAYVDVPGYSIYTQEEMDQFVGREATWTVTKTERGATFARATGSGYMVSNGTYGGDGFDEETEIGYDTYYGAIAPINGKTFIDMLGGYTLKDIQAFRFQSTGSAYYQLMFKDGVGLWDGLATPAMTVNKGSDGYYTVDVSKIPTGKLDGWYPSSKDWTLEDILNNTKFINFNPTGNLGKEVYGWQVVLYKPLDRSALKKALVDFAGLELASYKTAMEVYYDKNAGEDAIAEAVAALLKDVTPATPDAPVAEEITHNSVTLRMGAKKIQYKCNDGEWTSGNEFTGLTPNTEYRFYARVAPMGNVPASEPSEPLVVTTLKEPITGEVTILGDAVYGETLTASVEGLNKSATGVTYSWMRGNTGFVAVVGTGETYVITKSDIGETLHVTVTASNLEGRIVSENTAVIEKATPELITPPSEVTVIVGSRLGDAALANAEVSVPGTWAWAAPDTVLEVAQSGSGFEAIFTPENSDVYKTVSVFVTVNVDANTQTISVVDSESGISLEGEFLIEGEHTMVVEEIGPAQSAYLALLRAANHADGNNLILLRNIGFTTQCFVGTMTLKANISIATAGETYTVWYFANGEVKSAEATVAADGTITVTDFVVDVK